MKGLAFDHQPYEMENRKDQESDDAVDLNLYPENEQFLAERPFIATPIMKYAQDVDVEDLLLNNTEITNNYNENIY